MTEFIPELTTLAAYTVAVVVLALTPGPDMALFLAQSITNGRSAGLLALAGASTGLIGHSIIASVGLSALLAASPMAFTALKWIGAGYLCWLAWTTLRHGSELTRDITLTRQKTLWYAYAKGLMINLLNPKIILFFVTFLPQFVSIADPHAGGKLFFLGLWFIAVSVPVIVPLIWTAAGFSAWLKRSRRVSRVFDYAFAGVMGGFAAKLLLAQTK
ncbi:MAG: LysE family translocator [Tepidamorphaceae bacterium]|nr:LysE family translocator [Rhodobiaceae bacterium]